MQKILGGVCAFLGAFLLVAGVLAQTWGASQLKKTPLDVDSVTRLSGTAESSGPNGVESYPVKVTSTTKADSAKSDDEVVVFKNSTCLVKDEGDVGDCVSAEDPQQRLLSASFDDFATDRKTGLAVNDAKYLPEDAAPHEGLVNKWPFDVEKKSYPYSAEGGQAVDADYVRTEEVHGVETYVFKVVVPETEVQITDDIRGIYSETTELWIEPVTGQIVDQVSEQVRTLEDGSPFLTVNVSFTDAQVKKNADESGADASKLNLVTKTVPTIGYAVGIPLLLIGIGLEVLAARRRRRAGQAAERTQERAATPTA